MRKTSLFYQDLLAVASVAEMQPEADMGAVAVAAAVACDFMESSAEYHKVKKALLAAFAADPYLAYDQFVNRMLRAGESPDVYLVELRRLAILFGKMNKKTLACAFVSGLPEEVHQLLRAGHAWRLSTWIKY
ncbi:hypothetical protein O3P69_009125 [Scylla paramamosain]|uniref:Uncharacterized protein n=1 Tax=Scylla paramamosain TaxID=85552 RepID=A0AAW0TA23_SCYPA